MISNEDIIEITLNASKFLTWHAFHSYFQHKFGFPEFYGKNMNAWVDCMGDLDKPEYGMTKNISIRKGQCVVLKINNIEELKLKAHDIYIALIECSASINNERMRAGELPLFFLSF